MNTTVQVIISAMTESPAMKSNTSKYHHRIIDKTVIELVTLAAKGLGIAEENISVVEPNKSAMPIQMYYSEVLFLDGDMPLITTESLAQFLDAHRKSGKSATSLSNSDGIYCIDSEALPHYTNATELLDVLVKMTGKSNSEIWFIYTGFDEEELLRINNRRDLAVATSRLRDRINGYHMDNGVTIVDPSTTYIGFNVSIGADTTIFPSTVLEGNTSVGCSCMLGPNSVVFDSQISDGVKLRFSECHDSKIGADTTVGPYAYIRPNSNIGEHVKIGDFVEIKNSNIGDYTSASHLTYIGDADVGNNINFGCGTVLCNYDGRNKYRTVIEDNAFIGCNSNLVAPVTIKAGAYTAAGSTITDDVPENTLAIARARQVNKSDWKKNQ